LLSESGDIYSHAFAPLRRAGTKSSNGKHLGWSSKVIGGRFGWSDKVLGIDAANNDEDSESVSSGKTSKSPS
jgi:hypothetical protein